jgi:hypothetical protein
MEPLQPVGSIAADIVGLAGGSVAMLALGKYCLQRSRCSVKGNLTLPGGNVTVRMSNTETVDAHGVHVDLESSKGSTERAEETEHVTAEAPERVVTAISKAVHVQKSGPIIRVVDTGT